MNPAMQALNPAHRHPVTSDRVKACTVCGEAKSVNAYYVGGTSPDGSVYYRLRCQDCSRSQRRAYFKRTRR